MPLKWGTSCKTEDYPLKICYTLGTEVRIVMKKEKIGEFIKEEMQNKKVSKKEMAKSLGVPSFVINLYWKGIVFPSIYNLELIAFKLNVSLNELLGGSLEKQKDDDMVYFYALNARKRKIILTILYLILLIIMFIV